MSIDIAAFRPSHRPSKRLTWASVLLWASAAAALAIPVPGLAQLRSGMPGPADEGAQAPARPVDPKGQQGGRGGEIGSLAPQPSLGAPAPKPGSAAPAPRSGPFNGTWTITYESTSCILKNGSVTVVVAGHSVGGRGSGRVSQSGHVRWTAPAELDGGLITWTGTLSGAEGVGTFSRHDGRCRGTFAAKRG
jgi:hypothetical protein